MNDTGDEPPVTCRGLAVSIGQEGCIATDHVFLERIAARHGLVPPASWGHPWIGATSRVYPFGDVVIKVALDTPEAERAVAIDAAMNPVARELGVLVPALVAFDGSREIVPVPYVIFERVRDAMPLGDIDGTAELARGAWEAAGRNLALVHTVIRNAPMPTPLREFRQAPEVDPRPWVRDLQSMGRLAPGEAAWLLDVLDGLADAALSDIPLHLCHGDVNSSNILVTSRGDSGVTLIDWAGAGWLDPVWDFVGVPLEVVPLMLAGHRAAGPLPDDETAEARILWCQLQMRLLNARSQPDVAIARVRLEADIAAVRAFASDHGWPS